MRVIETERLQLRSIIEKDFEDFQEYASDDELSRMFGWPQNKDRARIRRIFDRLVNGEKTYAIVYKAHEKMIGHLTIAFSELPETELAKLRQLNGVTFAFAIAPAYQRKGLITEALTVTIAELFDCQEIDYIHCGYFEWNTASKCLQEKLGFLPCGNHVVKGRTGEMWIMDNILYKPMKVNRTKLEFGGGKECE